MQSLKTPNPWRIAWALAVGLALVPTAGALSAQDNPTQTELIDKLIEQLGDEDYFIRQQAQAELARFSFDAFDALSAATTHEDLEIATRARYLLRLMRVQWTVETDPPEVKKLLGGYESLSQQDKLAKMRSLATLPEGRGVPALCRLVRYEKSPTLSKQAALELIGSQPPYDPPRKQLAELLRKNLGPSRRTAATWLMTWLRFGSDAGTGLGDWTKLVEAEYALLKRSRTQTDAGVVAKMIRFQIQWFKKLGRNDQTSAAMLRLVDLETGDPQTLAELLAWLVEQQAWDSVDKLAGRFPAQFANNPLLLYTVAQAQAEKGAHDQAEQNVRRALALNPGNSSTRLIKHYAVAQALWQRGMLPWAQREYQHIIDTATPGNEIAMASAALMAELLHDQGKEIEAAGVLEQLLRAVEKQPRLPSTTRARLPGTQARMNYFFACHHKSRNDRAQERAFLDKAVAADPTDVDALIARYRLPDQTPEYHKETHDLIERAAADLRQQIAQDSDNPTPYNQIAWLMANTEGDLDMALKCSRKSIQLNPGSGGFHDTLAHVYFARGDYEKAVETQTKAARMEPHSNLIARQLEVFRKKLEEAKKPAEVPKKPDGY